jgi:CDP-glucose 4,6-dehydratase
MIGSRLREDPIRFSGGWNFGPADASARSVEELVKAVIGQWGSGEWIDASSNNDKKLHEAGWLRLSCDKAHALLPWQAILTFEENIQRTVQWYKHFYDFSEKNLFQFCVHQISEYTSLAAQRGQVWARE